MGCICKECRLSRHLDYKKYKHYGLLSPRGWDSRRKKAKVALVIGTFERAYSRFCLLHKLPFEELCPEGLHAPERSFGVVCLRPKRLLFKVDLPEEEAAEWQKLALRRQEEARRGNVE